jgi:hypothetical protein
LGQTKNAPRGLTFSTAKIATMALIGIHLISTHFCLEKHAKNVSQRALQKQEVTMCVFLRQVAILKNITQAVWIHVKRLTARFFHTAAYDQTIYRFTNNGDRHVFAF